MLAVRWLGAGLGECDRRADQSGYTPTAQEVTALDIADAINEVAASRGWPPIQFYGHVRTALN